MSLGLALAAMASALHAQDVPAAPMHPAPAATRELFNDRLRLLDAGAQTLPPANPTALTQNKFQQYIEKIADAENLIDLVVDTPRLLVLKQIPKRIQLNDEDVVIYDVLSERELSLTGKKAGTRVLNLWFADPKNPTENVLLSYIIRVFPSPQAKDRIERVYRSMETELNRAFPDARVNLTMVGDSLLVRGQAKDATQAAQIIRILEVNGPELIFEHSVTDNAADTLPDTVKQLLRASTGQLDSSNAAEHRTNHDNRVTSKNSHIINMLVVPGENQVMLRVTVAEVNRSAARSIGLNFAYTASSSNGIFSSIQNLTGGLMGKSNLPMILDSGQIQIALNALRDLNLAKSLAEPNLVAVNGQSASFQAGGQFPVPVVTGATSIGLQGVNFVPFGVQLSFTPYITQRDKIRLVLSADVSTRDTATGASINGAAVPGVNTRNFQTTVDLRPGQTLAIAGLIQQNMGSDASRVPGPGDLPGLSSLLGNNHTSSSEQELVVLVNAELVEPLDPKELTSLPGADMLDPTDLEFFFGGRLEGRDHPDFRSATRSDFERLQHYEQLEELYIIGPAGYSTKPSKHKRK